MESPRRRLWPVLCFLLASIFSMPAAALDLEARRWSHIPLGSNFAGGAYAYTEADIKVDPALLLDDVEMKLDTVAAKYIHAFELWGKSARIDITQAYQKGRWKGLVNGVPDSVKRSGLSDTFVRFAVNFYGAPPLSGNAFKQYRASNRDETIVGAGLAVRLPTGDYRDDKLINLGQNRYVVRPQLGAVFTRDKWTTEITAEVFLYADNDDFFDGRELEQEPLLFTQAHLIRSLGPGEWLSFSLGYNYGGENTVDGDEKDNRSQNTGWAIAYSYPLDRQSGIKFSYLRSRTEESTGFDTESLAIGVVYSW